MEENPDSLVNQEVLTPGQLFLMFLKVGAHCFHLGPLLPLWMEVMTPQDVALCMFIRSCFGSVHHLFFYLLLVCLAERYRIKHPSLYQV